MLKQRLINLIFLLIHLYTNLRDLLMAVFILLLASTMGFILIYVIWLAFLVAMLLASFYEALLGLEFLRVLANLGMLLVFTLVNHCKRIGSHGTGHLHVLANSYPTILKLVTKFLKTQCHTFTHFFCT